MTGTGSHPFLDHGGPIPFAHRGGTESAPENTLAAFASAVALGYRYLETDVHATADGVLVAFHDDRLERVTDGHGVVAETTWEELRRARVGGREPILLFEELLDAFPSARINIEPKHDAAVAPLIRALRDARALERVCVGSFSDHRVAAVREALGSDLCTSLGTREVAALRVAAWAGGPVARRFRAALARRPARCVQVPTRWRGVPLLDTRVIAAAHDLGLPIHAWTINDEPSMRRLLAAGVDGIMTDRPTLLRDVLVRLGAWTDGPGSAGTG